MVFSKTYKDNLSSDIIENYLRKIDYKDGTYLKKIFDYKEERKYKEAIKLLNSSSDKKTNNKTKFLLSQLYYLTGESKKALSLLKPLVYKHPTVFVYIYLGLIYEDLKDFFSAVKYYRRSLKLEDNSIALYRLGKMFYRRKNYSLAIKYFSRLIEYDPSVRLANYYLGKCYLKKKNFPFAYRYFLKAQNFYPHSKMIAQDIVYIKKLLGKEYFLQKKKQLLKKRKEIKLTSYKSLGDNIPLVRIGILEGVNSVSFKSSGNIILEDNEYHLLLKEDTLYTITIEKGEAYLKTYEDNKIITKIKLPLYLKTTNHPFYILGAIYGKGNFWEATRDLSLRGSLEIIGHHHTLTVINVINIEEYLYGILPSEIYSYAPLEALKAQAVAARTLIVKHMGKGYRHKRFDFCRTVHCQVYCGMSSERKETIRAVNQTYGEVMFCGDKPIEAFYHSNCGGCLRSDLFGKKQYLQNKYDLEKKRTSYFLKENLENWLKSYPLTFCSYTKRKSNFRWQRIYDEEDFVMVFGFSLKSIKDIKIVKRGDCGHIDAMKIVLGNKVIDLRGDLDIRNFWDNLRSSTFIIEIKYTNEEKNRLPKLVLIWGGGFGHGVGMCQEGAIQMAEEGYSYKDILRHYYKNIKIEKIY